MIPHIPPVSTLRASIDFRRRPAMTLPLALSPLPAYDANAKSYEAFNIGERTTYLLDPLTATSLNDALGEATARWSWDRGDRLAIREIGNGDRLHVYAIRRKSVGTRTWSNHIPATEHARWLDHICTINLETVAGIGRGLVGGEAVLHARRQCERPEGAMLCRTMDQDNRKDAK